MSNQDNDSSHITFNNILELYQKCRRSGDWAKVYLETRGSDQFFTISVNVSAGSTAATSSGMERESKKRKKKPGQVRRDQQRRIAFLEKRRQAAALAEEARIDKIREEQVEKSDDGETGAGETGSGVGGETGQASEVGSGVSQTSQDATHSEDDDIQENSDEVDNIMQLDGNVSLSVIEEMEQEEEKPKRISLWTTTTDISMGEVREMFHEHGIFELDYFGSFTAKNEMTEEIVKVFQLRLKMFKGDKPKLDNMIQNWEKACRWCYCTYM